MKKMKYLLFGLCLVLFPMIVNANASENTPINVHIFKSSTCPHCEDALKFFGELSKDSEYGKYFKLLSYETNGSTSEIKANVALAEKVEKHFKKTFTGVPVIVIGDKRFSGFGQDMTTELKTEIKNQYNNKDYKDVVMDIKNNNVSDDNSFETIITFTIVIVLLIGVGYFIYLARKGTEEVVFDSKTEPVKVEKEVDSVENNSLNVAAEDLTKRVTVKASSVKKPAVKSAKKTTATKKKSNVSKNNVKKTTNKTK